MDWLMPVALSVGLIAIIFALIGLGWRSRMARQSDVGPPPAVPADPGELLCEAEGQYVVTTTAGDWLDRIAVHGLGVKSDAVAEVHAAGVRFARSGAPDVFIPGRLIGTVRFESGMAGKFVEKDGLVVIRWDLGGRAVDTAYRTRHAADRDLLRESIETIRQNSQNEGQL